MIFSYLITSSLFTCVVEGCAHGLFVAIVMREFRVPLQHVADWESAGIDSNGPRHGPPAGYVTTAVT